ncbi:unnamed protein product [Urochloa decumbens]|uniref:Uncharacterized protein n=1 Tax=Urochloa decumbens TaxID=240449 RepID=A0ABC9GHG0_9POAL
MVQKEVVAGEEPVMAGSSSAVAAPAGTDQLDLEAAEQLIQLSGGADDDVGSESRSADSVKCAGKKEKDKEAAAVESRRRSAAPGSSVAAAPGKDGDGEGGEPGSSSKGAAESFACSTAAGVEEEKDKAAAVVESPRRSAAGGKKDRDGGIVDAEERKRPKFRSLADIYRETDKKRVTPRRGGGGEGHADRDPSEDERKKKRRTKMIPVVEDWCLHMQVN